MVKNNGIITTSEALGGLKLALHALLELGLTPDQVLNEIRSQIEMLYGTPAPLLNLEGVELKPSSRPIIEYESGVFVSLSRRMIWQGNQKVLLTPNETKLMKIFINKPGITITHDELVMLIHGEPIMDVDPAEITRPWLSRLRQKLAALSGAASWIESVRGVGYVFVGVETQPS